MGIWTGRTDGVGVVGRGQCLFDKGCGSDEDGVFSSDVMGIFIVFGFPIKGANEVDISKSISFIDLHDKWESKE